VLGLASSLGPGIQTGLLLRYLEITKMVGAEIPWIPIFDPASRTPFSEIKTVSNSALRGFNKEDVILAITKYELYTTTEYRNIVNELDSDHMGGRLDTTDNFGTQETLIRAVSQLDEFTFTCHYKDSAIDRSGNKMKSRPEPLKSCSIFVLALKAKKHLGQIQEAAG
jgi:hypothetical protein